MIEQRSAMKTRSIVRLGHYGAVTLVLSILIGATHASAKAVFLKPDDVAWENLLSEPPAVGSDTYKAEIDKLLQWQNKRTETDIARCKSEEVPSPFIFSEVLGDKFTEKMLPVTAQLLKDAQSDIKVFTKLAKAKWARKRPPAVDSRIHPCVTLEENGSYPSAHAARGIVWASILSEIFPDKKAELIERGRLMGMDRVISGIHFSSDVEAGQKLGAVIFEKLMLNLQFKDALDQAKVECRLVK